MADRTRRPLRTSATVCSLSLVLGAGWWASPWGPGAGAEGDGPTTVVERDPAVSADGRRVVYVAPSSVDGDGASFDSVWLLDRADGTRTELTMPGDGIRPGRSEHPVLSDDGCSVVVVTELALDLFRDDDHGARWDVYRTVLPSCPGGFDVGEWELVSSVSDTDASASDSVDPTDRPATDGSGNLVAYTRRPGTADEPANVTWTTIDVVDLAVAIGTPGRLVPVPGLPAGPPTGAGSYLGQREPAMSGDGRFLAFRSDIDVTVVEHDTSAEFVGAWTDRVVDGQPVSQILRWDRAPSDDDEGALMRVVSANAQGDPGNGSSRSPAIDATGEVVAYASEATDLLGAADAPVVPAGLAQVYRTALGEAPGTALVSAALGTPGDGPSDRPSVDASGRLVAFETLATNLVQPAPTSATPVGGADLLLADAGTGAIRRITTDVTGVAQPFGASNPRLSASGRTVVFQTVATALPADAVSTNGERTIEQGPAAVTTGATDDTAAPWHVAVSVAPVSIDITDLDLGTAAIGTSTRSWYTTIVNHGVGAFVPASITTTAPEFAVTGGTCRRSVPVLTGESCTVEVAFTPTVDGPLTAELVVAERGFGAEEARARLSAVGGTPNVEGFPTSVDFGGGIVMLDGGSHVVTFANNGIAETGVAALQFGGTHPDDFSVAEDGCSGRLLSIGETCAVRVAFTPLDSGPRSATITAVATSGATAGVVLVGSGSYTPLAAVEQTSVQAPGRVDVVGLGFPAHAYVTIGWDGDDRTTIALTDDRGELNARLDVPRSLGGGRRTVSVIDPASHFSPVRTPEVVIGATPSSGGSAPAHRAP